MTDFRAPPEGTAQRRMVPKPSVSSALRRCGFGLSLFFFVIAAFYLRYVFFLIWGGTDKNYLVWAERVHYGPLSKHYLHRATALVAPFTGKSRGLLNGATAPAI